jgi:hypothetical protein
MNQAKKHYSSLFTLPSLKTAIAATIVPCLLVGLSFAFFFRSPQGIITGTLLGLAVFVVNFAADLSTANCFLKTKSLIFDAQAFCRFSAGAYGSSSAS